MNTIEFLTRYYEAHEEVADKFWWMQGLVVVTGRCGRHYIAQDVIYYLARSAEEPYPAFMGVN